MVQLHVTYLPKRLHKEEIVGQICINYDLFADYQKQIIKCLILFIDFTQRKC